VNVCYRGDLAVELADRTACGAALGSDGGIGAGRVPIKGQDTVAEIFFQDALDRLGERGAPFPCPGLPRRVAVLPRLLWWSKYSHRPAPTAMPRPAWLVPAAKARRRRWCQE